MTSASELFYQRRSRIGRHSDSDSPPPPAWINHRHRHNNSAGGNHSRRDRLDSDGCTPLRRPAHHPLQTSLHRSPIPPQEYDSIRPEEGSHQFSPSNSRVDENDRLPRAVLLARERLLERLRGVTLSSSRRSNRSPSVTRHSYTATDFSIVDSENWETEITREWVASITPIDQHPSKRPPGLTREAISLLSVELFCNKHDVSRAPGECSICLESFIEGDEMIRLPCGHRYHFCCLNRWLQTCGDCPYCRRRIHLHN